jgi:hypothetical protein
LYIVCGVVLCRFPPVVGDVGSIPHAEGRIFGTFFPYVLVFSNSDC